MENVIAFNNELSGLYENKPPISKAKMAAITRSAMRAIKFYKHVVQSVEKFILKCKSEYKVPGLYVIDSIVRQSRHQFGPEKDVFAPRFARNIKETFSNLFRCAPEDKSRIIRVLNLWQKNNVFAPEVIQPIFDLADPNHPIYQVPPSGGAVSNSGGPSGSGGMADMSANSSNGLNLSADMNMSTVSAPGGSNDDNLGVLPDLQNNLKQLLNDPNVLRQLQTLQNFQKFKQEEKKHKLNELRLQDEAFEKHIHSVLKGTGPSGQDESDFNKEVQFVSEEKKIEVINLDGNDSRSPTPNRERYNKRRRSRSRSRTRSRSKDRSGRDRDRRRRSRSRSRNSRSPRTSNRRRAASRDRERSERARIENRDKEKDREYERERRKKGLPEIRKEHLSVCSTTLWVGHLSKLVYQEELSDTFGEYGDIVSIDQIVPRGCAFIVMNRRQDAYKAMQSLKSHKLQGRAITISWAAGKGVKSKEWKDYWDLELGVTYIPWTKLDENTDMDSLEEGGMFDADTMPTWMKNKINHSNILKEKGGDLPAPPNLLFGIDTTQPPPGPPPPGGPPPMMPLVTGQFTMAPPMTGPPRLLGPMGMPLQGISMPPNMVAGLAPPHAMMLPTGMLPPNFPPMPPGQVGGPVNPMEPAQFAGPPGGGPGAPPPPGMGNNTSDDQMDIEEDEETSVPVVPPPAIMPMLNFNQPPPMFGPGVADTSTEVFSRDRNRPAGGTTRWGARGVAVDDCVAGHVMNSSDLPHNTQQIENSGGGDGVLARWRDSFGNNGAPVSFNDGRNSGPRGTIPINILPLDLNNPPQRPDFMNEFENRGGGGPRGNGRMPNHSAEFFPNMQNRFNQPTSLLQMRIPPPNSFNPRMGGPPGGQPMFMRAQGAPGPGRQQGAGGGGYFNPRNPFDRDGSGRGGRGVTGGGVGGGRGGNGRGGRSNSGNRLGNWSDDEEDSANSFKRRGPIGGGNRFRERGGGDLGNDERNSRDRGGRRGGGGTRLDYLDDGEQQQRGRNGNNSNNGGNRAAFLDESGTSTELATPSVTKNDSADTEDDWDKELEEYDARMAAENAARELQNNNKQGDVEAPVPTAVDNQPTLPVTAATENVTQSVGDCNVPVTPTDTGPNDTTDAVAQQPSLVARPEQHEKQQQPISCADPIDTRQALLSPQSDSAKITEILPAVVVAPPENGIKEIAVVEAVMSSTAIDEGPVE